MSDTVGNLNIEVQLQLQQMQAQFDKLEGTVKKQSGRIGAAFAVAQRANQRAIEKTGESIGKMALKFVTAEKAISFFKQRLTAVFANPIEASQGDVFLADAVVSAQEKWQGFLSTVDYVLARIAGGGAALLNGGEIPNYTPDERARIADKAFDTKLQAANAQLLDATRAKQMAEMTEAEKVLELREKALELAHDANKEGLNSLEIAQRKTAATNAETAALTAMAAMRKELKEAEKEVSRTTNLAADSGSNPFATARSLSNRAWAVRTDISNLKLRDQDDPKVVQDLIDKNKELAGVQERLARAQEKSAEMGMRAGEAITDGLSGAIFEAKNAKEVFDDVVSSLARMIIQQAILAPIAESIGGSLSGIFGGFFAAGGEPPLGKVSVVGEQGPELFVPKSSGIVVPAGVTSSLLSGGGSSGATVFNMTYHIQGDAVSKSELVSALRAHSRAVEASFTDALSRGGNKARKFGG